MHFVRALRAAGLPLGPGHALRALEAVETVGLERRVDLYWALHSVLVNRRDQQPVFDQCFHVFWRDPKILERMMQLLLPQLETERPVEREEVSRRVGEALGPDKLPGRGEGEEEPEAPEIELDAVLTWSAREQLSSKDFEQMSAEELERARKAIARLRLPIALVRTRRFAPDPRAPRIDLRRTLRRSLRGGAAAIDLVRRRPRLRPPPVVILCDVSGSMARYSRMLLLFMHTLASDRERVHSFVFGTRLTNITRHLRAKDVDQALARVGELVQDWSGGTRIGACLEEFNRSWSRRVLGQGALVLLITDGLDRDAGEGLAAQMERLHKSCRRLVWLNPLLRYEAYQPISAGARAMIAHVDELRTVHNLDSLEALARVLGEDRPRRAEGLSEWVATARERRAA